MSKITEGLKAEIARQSDVISKNLRDNFTNYQAAINDNQDQISALSTAASGAEITQSRPNHSDLKERLDSKWVGRENFVKYGGIVTEQGTPDMTVAITAGEATVNGVDCKWSAQNSGIITAPVNERYDILAVKSDNTLEVVTGADSADPVLPAIATTQRPIAIIKLTSATATIIDSIITDISSQGCIANGLWFFKIQDAVDSLDDRTNSSGGGIVHIMPGEYYEEVILTGLDNISLIGSGDNTKIYRPSDTKGCIESINSGGSETTGIKLYNFSCFGNSKAGSNPNIDLQYTDEFLIDGVKSDGNSSSSATGKDIELDNCDNLYINSVKMASRSITNITKSTRILPDTIELGVDTNLYRSAANTLKTDDEVVIGINGGKDTLSLSNTTVDVGITIGVDTNLYRSAANTLKTDDKLTVGQQLVAQSTLTVSSTIIANGEIEKSKATRAIATISSAATTTGDTVFDALTAYMSIGNDYLVTGSFADLSAVRHTAIYATKTTASNITIYGANQTTGAITGFACSNGGGNVFGAIGIAV